MVRVRRPKPRAFRKDQRGVTLLEGLITFPIVLILLTVMGEFGYAVYQWNQTVKAMQLGVRLAAVSDPLTSLEPIEVYYTDNATVGFPTPVGAPSVTCGANATACENDDQLRRLVFGVNSSGVIDTQCDPDYGNVAGICDFNPRIGTNNVRITYAPSGLGYVGQPGPPVVTITLEVVNLNFQLPLLGALLGFNTIQIPAHPVTVTSEDLSNDVP